MKPARTGRDKQRWDGETRLVAGVVPIFDGEIVLVKSTDKAEYILPKGGWDIDETKAGCAKREAYEEAGVEGNILGKELVEIEFVTPKGNRCHMSIFALEVTKMLEEWPERARRERQLFTPIEAISQLTRPGMADAIHEAQKLGLLIKNKKAGVGKKSAECYGEGGMCYGEKICIIC
mmetsp:Transcript_41907/g.68752  ORF Transcript_41907/g.68752 Transcript_41907/m.68752 type:complete len:177 (+) Transcript_41907:130-660(+)